MTIVVAGLSGCGSQRPEGTLSGQVTYHGKPVNDGEVQFYCSEGFGATAQLDAAGRFTVDGLMPVGTYDVCVLPRPAHPNLEGPREIVKPPEVPRKARDLRTSGVSVQLKAGKNDVILELKD